MSETIVEKTCSKCKQTFPATPAYFYRKLTHLTSRCRECSALDQRTYRMQQSDRVRTNQRRSYAKRASIVQTQRRADRRTNPDKYRVSARLRRQKNRDRINALQNKRRALNIEKARMQARAARLQHREHRNAQARAKYAANPEAYRRAARTWRAEHPEQAKILARRHRLNHPETERAAGRRKRARKAHAPINDLTAAQWREIQQAFNFRCAYCQRQMQRLTQDHITPLSQGGAHTVTNVIPACQSCNSKKWTGPPLIPVQPLLFTLARMRSAITPQTQGAE